MSEQTDLTEVVTEWLKVRDKLSLIGGAGLLDARSLLAKLAEAGVVRLAKGQTSVPVKKEDVYKYEDMWMFAREAIKEDRVNRKDAGFVRVLPLLPEDKP